jgi:hypothetical protein
MGMPSCRQSKNTVADVREELEATAEIPQLDRTIGADSKSWPARRSKSGSAMAMSNLSNYKYVGWE